MSGITQSNFSSACPNVIFLSKENEILVQSGALEYEDDKYSILNIVADNIDGGIYTIQQRVKRYEKNI